MPANVFSVGNATDGNVLSSMCLGIGIQGVTQLTANLLKGYRAAKTTSIGIRLSRPPTKVAEIFVCMRRKRYFAWILKTRARLGHYLIPPCLNLQGTI